MYFISLLSAILTICCVAWLIGLFVFALVKKIMLRVKAKKEIKKHEKRLEK
jgi:putative effector of murein hydrolase LrgA (UPF0299 family)